MLRRPDHRYVTAHQAVADGSDLLEPRVAALKQAIAGEECPDHNVQYALDLFSVEDHRMVMDAFVLAKVNRDVMSRTLDIPVDVIETYAYLFMDVTAFRNRLEVMSYAAQYPGPVQGKELVRAAVTVGPDYLLWTYGQMRDFDNRAIIRQTMTDAYFRGMAHKGNAITSGVAKEAQKWFNMSIKNAELIERVDPRTSQNALDELKIALEAHDETVSVEQAPTAIEDILH